MQGETVIIGLQTQINIKGTQTWGETPRRVYSGIKPKGRNHFPLMSKGER